MNKIDIFQSAKVIFTVFATFLFLFISFFDITNKVVLEPRVSPEHTSKYVDTVTVFANLNQRSLTPRWPLTQHLLRSHVWLYPRIIVSKSHGNTSMYVDTVINFAILQITNQRSPTPKWPLTPHLLRSYVWWYPRIIVSKSHENTSKYVDTVNLFAKTWTKGHWPLDDRWPHICWGLMCDATQGSLCPSPMKIHQSMWIQWPFLQKKNLNQRSLTPDDLWPHICWGHMCDFTQESLCPSPMKIHQSMWTQWTFLLKLEPKVIDP